MNKFSVVIPCYNSSLTIKDTLQSVSEQTIKPYEVIIVDDNSKDQQITSDIIDLFRNDLNIIFIHHDMTMNGATARNTGIDASTGDFICFLDSDDIWMQNKLEIVDKLIESEVISDDFIFYSQVYVGERGTILDECRIYPSEGYKQDITYSVGDYIFVDGGLIQTSTIVCSVRIAKEVKFNPNFIRHQDFDFVIRAHFLGCKFFFYSVPLVKWIQQPKSATTYLKKGESPDFCKSWMEEMAVYLTDDAKTAYKLFYLASRYKSNRRYIDFIQIYFHVAFCSSLKFKMKLIKRIIYKLLK